MSTDISSITTEGITMRYMKFGTGPRTMVILPCLAVKSVLLSADAIANQYKSVTEDFTIYLFDRREELPDNYTIEQMAEDTAKVMKALGLSGVYLFGASQGGMMSLVIAARYPELVSKLVAGSTCARFDDSNSSLSEWVTLAEEGRGEELCLGFASKIYPASIAEATQDFFADTGRSVTEEEFARFVVLAKATDGFDITPELKSTPTTSPALSCSTAKPPMTAPSTADPTCSASSGCSCLWWAAPWRTPTIPIPWKTPMTGGTSSSSPM